MASPTAGKPPRPSPASLRWGGGRTFEAIPGGTRITFSGGGRSGGFFGLAEPLPLRAAQRSLRSDPADLKLLRKGQLQD